MTAIYPTRRHFLAAFAATPVALRAADFWRVRPEREWTATEVRTLLTYSPWASTLPALKMTETEAVAFAKALDAASRAAFSAASPAGPMLLPDTEAEPEKTRRKPKKADLAGVPPETWTVVWESAAPVRAVTGAPYGDAFNGMWVIGVEGATPPPEGEEARWRIALRNATRLKLGDQSAAPAEVLYSGINGSVWYFGFKRDSLQGLPAASSVRFLTAIWRHRIRVLFEPKEMVYQDQVAL